MLQRSSMHSPVALLTQQNQIRRFVCATSPEWTDMMDGRRPINVGSTSLTYPTISMIHIFPKPLPVFIIGIIPHPHIAKELIVGLDPLSGLHRHYATIITGLYHSVMDLVVMIVIRYHDRAVVSMLIRVADPN